MDTEHLEQAVHACELPSGSLAGGACSWIKKQLEPREAAEAVQEEGPFLSVVTRTQGKREDELREVLLCLSAQSDIDFELLVVGHRVHPADREKVLRVISETPPFLQQRTRYLPLEEEGRSAPLNFGFSMARGQYIAILDDDDLVMDHWVETFHQLANKQPGVILHAYAAVQNWRKGEASGDLYAVGPPEPKYCKDFDWIRQWSENHCPTMSLAFPAWLFRGTALRFDNTLNTTEDWELLMRAASIAGVADAPELTSIYRLWDNAESSATLHDKEHWDDNYKLVTGRFDKQPLLLPPGSAGVLDALCQQADELKNKTVYNPEAAATLHLRDMVRFKTKPLGADTNHDSFPAFRHVYRDLSGKGIIGPAWLQFNPTALPMVSICHFRAELVSPDGETQVVTHEQASCSGCKLKGRMSFLQGNAQVYFPVPAGFEVDEVHILGILENRLPRSFFKRLLCDAVSHASFVIPGKGDDKVFVPCWNSAEAPCAAFRFDNLSGWSPLARPYIELHGYLGLVLFENVCMCLTFTDGTQATLGIADCAPMGSIQFSDRALTVWDYPHLPVPVPPGKILESLVFTGRITRSINVHMTAVHNALAARFQNPAFPVMSAGNGVAHNAAVLYADLGAGFSAEESQVLVESQCAGPFEYDARLPQTVRALRFDPSEATGVMLDDFSAIFSASTGEEATVPFKKCRGNGTMLTHRMVFLKRDPQLYIPVPPGSWARVTLRGKMHMHVPDEVIDAVAKVGLLRRAWRKLRRMLGE